MNLEIISSENQVFETGYLLDSSSYSKTGRYRLHEVSDDPFLSQGVKKYGVIADSWSALEKDHISLNF